MFLIRISALYLCHCSAVWLVVYCWSSFFTRGLVLDYWDMVCRPRRRRHEENRGNEGRALRGFPEHRIELLPSTGSIHFRCRRRHSLYGIHELGSPVLHRIHPLGADLRSIFDRGVFLHEKIYPMGFCVGKGPATRKSLKLTHLTQNCTCFNRTLENSGVFKVPHPAPDLHNADLFWLHYQPQSRRSLQLVSACLSASFRSLLSFWGIITFAAIPSRANGSRKSRGGSKNSMKLYELDGRAIPVNLL